MMFIVTDEFILENFVNDRCEELLGEQPDPLCGHWPGYHGTARRAAWSIVWPLARLWRNRQESSLVYWVATGQDITEPPGEQPGPLCGHCPGYDGTVKRAAWSIVWPLASHDGRARRAAWSIVRPLARLWRNRQESSLVHCVATGQAMTEPPGEQPGPLCGHWPGYDGTARRAAWGRMHKSVHSLR